MKSVSPESSRLESTILAPVKSDSQHALLHKAKGADPPRLESGDRRQLQWPKAFLLRPKVGEGPGLCRHRAPLGSLLDSGDRGVVLVMGMG
jgi:hypothetical protein